MTQERILSPSGSGVPRRSGGFTLIELILAAAMAATLFAALYSFYRSQVYAFRAQETSVNVKEEADVGIDFLVKEIRLAGARPLAYPPGGCTGVANPPTLSPPCPGFERITEARSQRIVLRYDFRGDLATDPADGCPNDAGEHITYSYDAAARTILRTLGTGAAAVLVRNVPPGGFNITYRDRDRVVLTPGSGGLSAAERASIATVEVTVSSQIEHPDPSIAGPITSTRSSTAFLRNPRC